jgi:hypothetical protein
MVIGAATSEYSAYLVLIHLSAVVQLSLTPDEIVTLCKHIEY